MKIHTYLIEEHWEIQYANHKLMTNEGRLEVKTLKFDQKWEDLERKGEEM